MAFNIIAPYMEFYTGIAILLNDMLIDIMENTTSMKHPVIFQSINLCQKRDSQSINRHGEKRLKCMVESVDLSPLVQINQHL